MLETPDSQRLARRAWHAIWTRSHCEQAVAEQLDVKRFEVFLPMMSVWGRRAGTRRLIQVPMFPGYVFVHHAVDKPSYIEIVKARGVVRILGERWDRLEPIPDCEVESLRDAVNARLPMLPHAYLREGQRVRITGGPLAGLEGILLAHNMRKGLLVLSVHLLRRSVAVEIDCTLVAAA